ncbi:hypothetical protein VOLCADRAFT_90978 [Volvox carteri f. nagariensis]|uniref:Uncharacterized protein n=1 Tax=Volvox carteri f. nagariensis TaxID=3068 RepID=D8TVV8_VOLCA|nr:uncharacterized protein VOLCADRAFT_90978 [Volvox carteri f. nagariensis]EFJ48370.1 hypothetical protein VOLCADRAFT_90978 [Volvox carteri f. nagariensis]|eukprot:XP_002950624.1 hypothetical protein VOLCADRAFT_90978 [Volvox carteri f. nagariensis]
MIGPQVLIEHVFGRDVHSVVPKLNIEGQHWGAVAPAKSRMVGTGRVILPVTRFGVPSRDLSGRPCGQANNESPTASPRVAHCFRNTVCVVVTVGSRLPKSRAIGPAGRALQ